MNATIRERQALRQALQQRAQAAAAEFRSKSRFFVQPSGQGWAVVSASTNRLYGQHPRYFEAVRYAESLEHAIDSKTVAMVGAKQVGERATRWVSLFALMLVLVAGAASA